MDRENKRSKVYQNFNRKNRWLGIIDYKSLIFLLVYIYIIWQVTSFFNVAIMYRIYVLVICSIPVFSLIVVYMSEESVMDMLWIIVKYMLSPKKYLHIPKKAEYIGLVKTRDNFDK